MSGTEYDPIESYETIINEIKKYDENMLKRPSIIIASKMDIENSKENLAKFQKKYPNLKIYPISSIYNEGIKELITDLNKLVKENADKNFYEELNETHTLYKYENKKPFKIYKDNNIWVIEGKEIEDLFLMTRFNEDESVLRFARKLKKMGVEDELEKLGAKRGEEVKILDYIFNFKE